MRLNVNPNRMELNRLKRRLLTAVRGHKLLKDKQDELVRRFIVLARQNDALRREVEAALMSVGADFRLSGAEASPEFLEEAVMLPKVRATLEVSDMNMMNVRVPRMKFALDSAEEDGIFPYGFLNTSESLDRAVTALYRLMPRLLLLGEVEKSVYLMADEIQKTRRRVNALEYMTIPQLKETIRYITMKLEENERGALTRLMKVKAMIDNS